MCCSRHSPASGLLRSRSWEHLPCSLPDPLVAPLMARPLLWMAAGRPNNMRRQGPRSIPRVVVIGAGFGGLEAVRALRRAVEPPVALGPPLYNEKRWGGE